MIPRETAHRSVPRLKNMNENGLIEMFVVPSKDEIARRNNRAALRHPCGRGHGVGTEEGKGQ